MVIELKKYCKIIFQHNIIYRLRNTMRFIRETSKILIITPRNVVGQYYVAWSLGFHFATLKSTFPLCIFWHFVDWMTCFWYRDSRVLTHLSESSLYLWAELPAVMMGRCSLGEVPWLEGLLRLKIIPDIKVNLCIWSTAKEAGKMVLYKDQESLEAEVTK